MTPDDLRYLLRRPIAFHRAFADIAGSAAGGLFLSQLFYWCDRGDDPDGWIYKSIEEWREETCLTRYEQEAARRALTACGVLESEKRGMPRRLYFRLDLAVLASLLETASKSAAKPQASLLDPASKPAQNTTHIYTETTQETTQEKGGPRPPRSISELSAVLRKPPQVGRR
jgi:hypothetical protein